MPRPYPDRDQIMKISESFMEACVLGAAAELDLFSLLTAEPSTASGVAERIGGDRRCTEVLLDAAAALCLLDKSGGVYSVPEPLQPLLTDGGRRRRCR